MVALARTCRWSTARARAILELTAVVAGILLGGRAGAGTLIYAAAIGPAVQWSIRLFPEDLT